MRSLIIITLIVISALGLQAQEQDSSWYWRKGGDPDTVKRYRAELDSLLELHRMWSWNKSRGEKLYLKNAYFHLNLDSANLEKVDLSNSCLFGTLINTNLSDANLTGADFGFFNEVSSAIFIGANLSDSKLIVSRLNDAEFNGANLSGVNFEGSILISVDLSETNLCGANFYGADLNKVVFEKIDFLPNVDDIAFAQRLNELTFEMSPASLTRLRKAFADAGYKSQERQVICALRRHDQNWFERIFFDWTCEYGSNLRRPFWVLFWIWLACGGFYWFCMMWRKKSGVSWIIKIKPGPWEGGNREIWKHLGKYNSDGTRLLPPQTELKLLPNKIPTIIRLIWWAFFFSTISAFNIGFRDFSFGRWIKLLTRSKFDLEPFGWVRTISGVQALISIYLAALWILSFSGTPFVQ